MSWQRVRGHDALIAAFDRLVSGRLAHGYLFIGPPGVGKRLFADELAKVLLCEAHEPPSVAQGACDRCDACKQIQAGTHPDFFVAARPENSQAMPIEVLRELTRSLALKSARGRGKIAIVDDADDLHDPITGHAAANCFLKTLEEPPPRSLLVLISTSPDLQLPTIVSRCQIVTFAPLPAELVAELLQAQGVDDAKLRDRLVRLSHGSPGQARALADPDLWTFRRTLLDGLTQPRVESVALAKQFMQFVEEAGKESAAQRRRAALVVHLLVEFLTNALTLSVGGTPELAEPEDQRALETLVQRADPDRLLDLLERCLEADIAIDRRVQLTLLLEALLDAPGQKTRQWATT